ncbi:ATP-binding cassette domain-containing protein [Klebsiella pneumoniae subsp. pneumoniae]|nr:ATP-binding cassette domain-containing protein [Klebsiella pneumoniae subsp. pneumoniae]
MKDYLPASYPAIAFANKPIRCCSWRNINVSFDGFRALTDLSLAIGVGELRCVIGPNGAGKTTLMDVITGRDPAAERQSAL